MLLMMEIFKFLMYLLYELENRYFTIVKRKKEKELK
jgi:hypothetical protein